MLSGYQHSEYANSLAEFGEPISLPRSNGWLLQRNIPGSDAMDAMGCYPLFLCQSWDRLGEDLESLSGKLVSVVLVADPFGDHNPALLESCFPDRLLRFKEHFVVDLNRPWKSELSSNHSRNVAFSKRHLTIKRLYEPTVALDEWHELYSFLVKRHSIRGISAFSKASFARQLAIPGLVVFQAFLDNELVGMVLWYICNDIAYYHLAAYSEKGYHSKASFGIFWESFCHFADSGCRWIDLGAGAGLAGSQEDGLTRFKKGWATDSRPAYLGGRILNHSKYHALRSQMCREELCFFPIYRAIKEDSGKVQNEKLDIV